MLFTETKTNSLRAGFEPAREYPIGFQVQRLNHSAITAVLEILNKGIEHIMTSKNSFGIIISSRNYIIEAYTLQPAEEYALLPAKEHTHF